MKKMTKKRAPREPKGSDRAFARALAKVDADKEWIADVKDVLQAKRPEDAKRFIVPSWYLAPEAIKALRKQLKVSQSQLATTIGVNVKTVQLWEQKTGALGMGSILLKSLIRHPWLYGDMESARPERRFDHLTSVKTRNRKKVLASMEGRTKVKEDLAKPLGHAVA